MIQCVTKIRIEMSRSIHTTYKNVKGLTKNELGEQYNDPDSDLTQLAKKLGMKNQVRKIRKQIRNSENGCRWDVSGNAMTVQRNKTAE